MSAFSYHTHSIMYFFSFLNVKSNNFFDMHNFYKTGFKYMKINKIIAINNYIYKGSITSFSGGCGDMTMCRTRL